MANRYSFTETRDGVVIYVNDVAIGTWRRLSFEEPKLYVTNSQFGLTGTMLRTLISKLGEGHNG